MICGIPPRIGAAGNVGHGWRSHPGAAGGRKGSGRRGPAAARRRPRALLGLWPAASRRWTRFSCASQHRSPWPHCCCGVRSAPGWLRGATSSPWLWDLSSGAGITPTWLPALSPERSGAPGGQRLCRWLCARLPLSSLCLCSPCKSLTDPRSLGRDGSSELEVFSSERGFAGSRRLVLGALCQ